MRSTDQMSIQKIANTLTRGDSNRNFVSIDSNSVCRDLASSGFFGKNAWSASIGENICNSIVNAFNLSTNSIKKSR